MFFSGIADEAGTTIDVQIKAHKELDWKHIEIRNIQGVNLTDLCDETFEELADMLAAAGLAVSCFASQLCNWSRPIIKHPDIDRRELLRAIPRMQELGCRFIRIMSYPNAGWPEEKWRDEVVSRLKMLAEIAEDSDITLLHENCDGWGGRGPQQSLELLRRVNSPNLKLLWDTGNPSGHAQDPWAYYSAVREHVVYVHIKDCAIENGKLRYTFPGEGQGKVREVLRDLKQHGYKGGLSIEPHLAAIVHEGKAASETEQAYGKYLEYGRRLMKLVESLG
jgi:sugar phosphate isomerase/epimerase